MNTKILMTSSAIVLGLLGITFTFLPLETLNYFGMEKSLILIFLIQILGALYFSFGMLNWMSKSSIIGGIYNRPIVVANFSHFFIAGLALIKGLLSNLNLPIVIWIIGAVYLIFLISFGLLFFKHPKK